MLFIHLDSNEYNYRFENRHIYHQRRSGHVTCNVWGWMHGNGVGEIAAIEGRFTADKYIELLEEVMLPSVRAMAIPYPERIIFMQDNCPIHTARIVRRWFADRVDAIELLHWPSKGCDMNPIENIWACMVNQWEPGAERTKRALLQHTETIWEGLRGSQTIPNSVMSMPDRLQEVIAQGGRWSSY